MGTGTGAARGAVGAPRPAAGSAMGTGNDGAPGAIEDAAGRRFEPAADIGAEVRAFARTTLERWGIVPDETVLIVHELTTARGATTPGATPFTVTLSRRDFRVRVEVTGDGPVDSSAAPAGDGLGRGLVMVRSLARTWGMLVGDGGSTAWAEIDAHR